MEINVNRQKILVENSLIAMPSRGSRHLNRAQLATIMGNITYYGYALSKLAYDQLLLADVDTIEKWWNSLEKALRSITGDDKNMADFVVYKNFPKEVLDMSQAEYWFKQILMYWGLPNELFVEEAEERETAIENIPVKVLHSANDDSFAKILSGLFQSPVRWTPRQWETICELLDAEVKGDVSSIGFKENMVQLFSFLMEKGYDVSVKTATDVLRLAVGLSDGDISLRTNSRFRKFARAERRFLLSLLESCNNLEEDVARRRGQFKRLFFALHPGDYKERFKNVVAIYDKVYRGVSIRTFNSEIERLLAEHNSGALNLLQARPGEFLRRLRVATNIYGVEAADAFRKVIPRLTVHQLVKMKTYLQTAGLRKYRVFPPKGNWTKLQIQQADHQWDEAVAGELCEAIALEIKERIIKVVPSIKMSLDVDKVKLQGNDSDLTTYGRGTVFDIPENITFLRSASYWAHKDYRNTWFDNGWNFFDEDWKSLNTCCWNLTGMRSAIFSGDPTNSKDLEGRGCQLIDLYLDKLEKEGIRYAVWNILCFSHVSFSEASEVQAALQWGEKPEKNKLFEPSRCVFSFPITGNNYTKYIAYVDIQKRKLVYLDANLYGNVSSAGYNSSILEEKMPAFVEYLDSLPSVLDLFEGIPNADDGMPILYEDSEEEIKEGKAYVFACRNQDNTFEPFDINSLLKL